MHRGPKTVESLSKLVFASEWEVNSFRVILAWDPKGTRYTTQWELEPQEISNLWGKGSPLSARSQWECLKTQTSPSDSSEISILIRGESGFGQTSSFLPWKLICPGVRRHPQRLLTRGLSTKRPVGPTECIHNLLLQLLLKTNSFQIYLYDLLWLQVI